jgi:lipopolysaccharide transport system permease protein
LGSALFNAFISLGILLVAIVFFTHGFPVGVIFLPLLFLPLSFFLLGLVWFLSSLGVFVRDTLQAVNILVTLLMFLSPIFYPLSAVPESFRPFLQINPLVFIIAQFRNVLIFGRLPDWSGLLIYYVFSLGVMYLGWIWFLKTRKGFADVL